MKTTSKLPQRSREFYRKFVKHGHFLKKLMHIFATTIWHTMDASSQ